MSDSGKGDSPGFLRFELTIPADPGQQITLEGIARTLGWGITELPGSLPIAGYSPVNPAAIAAADFNQASTQVWGSAIYGETATATLHREVDFSPKDLRVHVGRTHSGTVVLPGFFFLSRQFDLDEAVRVRDSSMGEDALRSWILDRWDESLAPQTLKILPPEAPLQQEHHHRLFDVSIGDVDQGRLARYVQVKGYDGHRLHGSLGKSFDVMNVVAGVVRPAELGSSSAETNFMTRGDLLSKIRESGIGSHSRQIIRNKLQGGLLHQVETGRPAETGEIILEGRFSYRRRNDVRYEEIAVSSLVALADTFRNGSQAKGFLQSLE